MEIYERLTFKWISGFSSKLLISGCHLFSNASLTMSFNANVGSFRIDAMISIQFRDLGLDNKTFSTPI